MAIKIPIALVLLADARSIAASKGACRTGARDASVLIRMVGAVVATIANLSLIDANLICALESVAEAWSPHQ